MKRIVPVLLLMLLLPVAAGARQNDPLAGCNRLYHSGSYEEALTCYQDLTGEGPSAELLYNIGTAYAQLGRIGPSVLSYLRALVLAPSDADTVTNLRRVREHAGLFPPEPTPMQQFFLLLTGVQWALLALAVLAGYAIVLALQVRPGKRRLSAVAETTVSLLGLAVLLLCLGGSISRYHEWGRSVVLTDSRLLIAPFETAEPVGSISQGRLVTPGKRYEGYRYVTDETGRKGWLESTAIEPIIPDGQAAATLPGHNSQQPGPRPAASSP